jgi:hypothetical protein
MFTCDQDGRLIHSDLIYSCGKKGGKTEFGAIIMIVTVLLFGGRNAEGYCIANDLEQAQSRVYERCRRIIEASLILNGPGSPTTKSPSLHWAVPSPHWPLIMRVQPVVTQRLPCLTRSGASTANVGAGCGMSWYQYQRAKSVAA